MSIGDSVQSEGSVNSSTEQTKGVFSFDLDIFEIDIKTDTLYSSYFSTYIWTDNPPLPFSGVIFRPDGAEAIGFVADPVFQNDTEGESYIDIYRWGETLITDPAKVERPWSWRLTPKRSIPDIGLPWDTYELNFLYCLNRTFLFIANTTWVTIPRTIEGDWEIDPYPPFVRLPTKPNNQTLESLGISPDKFAQYDSTFKFTDYYLVKITISPPQTQITRQVITYLLPSFGLLVVLLISLYYMRRMSLPESVAIYFGSAFFALTFLSGILQSAPARVISLQEIIFFVDFWLSIGFAIFAIGSKVRERLKKYSYDYIG